MALTVKHLNSDASFLLSFEPVIPESIADSVIPRPFTILLDPWITGPSTIFHPRISITSHKNPACLSSLTELPEPPDLVIISQHKPDHCNEATLRQLPARGETLILAEPASARVIKSWKHFDKEKVRTIERWEDPRITGKQSAIRIPVPPIQPGGQEGEVTVAFIPQKHDLAGLHGAIGITYKSPPTHDLVKQIPLTKVLTPPATPESYIQHFINAEKQLPAITPTGDTFLLPPTPPMSPMSPMSPASPITPNSLRSIRSVSTLIASPTHCLYSPTFRPATSQNEKALPPSPYSHSRPISLIFSPHGIQYSCLAAYATSHLVAEAALPLTALLHCMDSISNPWWLGGNICAGVPYGAEIASKLGARLWISAHDGEKDVRGLATGLLKTRRWKDEEIRGALENRLNGSSNRRKGRGINVREKTKGTPRQGGCTEILRLECGEEILVSGTGRLWRTIASHDNIQSSINLTKDAAAAPLLPPPPPPQIVTGLKRQGKHHKVLETLVLPVVQDSMSPKKTGIYRALRTMDLIKPSPRLVMEHGVEGHSDESERVPGTKNPTKPEATGDSTTFKSDMSGDRAVRFAPSA
ncbi:hypothetical protein F4859DRAFT_197613 [Xylaria cf. heliscus]|nr:hypothetical protein F4859DRAFT_197613 [Xylaria cf. heliscus]